GAGARRPRVDLLILTASYGGGHRQVAAALAEAAGEAEPVLSCRVVDFFQAYSPLYSRFTRFTYTTAVRHFPRAYGWFYRASSRLAASPGLRDGLSRLGWRRMLEIAARFRPRLIVHTFPQTAAIHSALDARGLLPGPGFYTVVTDFTDGVEWLYPGTERYLVAAPDLAAGLAARGVEAGRVHATGIPLRAAFRRLPARAAARAALGLEPGRPVLLLAAGGMGTLAGLLPLVRRLDALEQDFQLLVVTGEDAATLARLRREAPRLRHPARLFGWLPDLAAAMAAADLLVGKAGGVTSAEALAAGLPLLLVPPVPGQEAVNAAYLARHGAALVARDAAHVAALAGRLLAGPAAAEPLRRAARRLARPEAARDAIRLLLRDPRLAGRADPAPAAAPVPGAAAPLE
ncbi:MAG: glycosyltransferase, partial [Clostridia bacterium]|nr:glycosyltransferase [Clostridia bacterium]